MGVNDHGRMDNRYAVFVLVTSYYDDLVADVGDYVDDEVRMSGNDVTMMKIDFHLSKNEQIFPQNYISLEKMRTNC